MQTEQTLSPFTAVIFDMDGLVLDTEITYFLAWKSAAKEMGFDLSEEFCLSLSGLPFHEVLNKIKVCCGVGFDPETFSRLSAASWRIYVSETGIAVKKGFFDMLQLVQTRKLPYCLATNSDQFSALECLRFAGLEKVFPLMVSRDQVVRGKPDPDLFCLAAERMKQPLASCLILEDSNVGIEAAAKTSAQSVFIPSINPPDPEVMVLADLVFSDLSQLAEFIRLNDY